jgi:DNA-binding IclR family transcriptional regulator
LIKSLANETGVTAHLAVLHGRDVLYLAKEAPENSTTPLISRVGLRLPAHLTAVGSAILIRLPAEQLKAIYPVETRSFDARGAAPVSSVS